MAKIAEFMDLVPKYSNEAVDFLVVYIQEAHPLDDWSFDFEKNKRYHHKTLEDRLEAGEFLTEIVTNVPVVVDNMEDGSCTAYGARPERLFIVDNGKIAYEGGIGPFHYDLKDLETSLKRLLAK